MVSLDSECRVLLCKFRKCDTEFVKVFLCLRLHCKSDYRIRELHRLQSDRRRLDADCVSGAEILESDSGTDVSGLYELDRILLVRVHLIKSRHALFLV